MAAWNTRRRVLKVEACLPYTRTARDPLASTLCATSASSSAQSLASITSLTHSLTHGITHSLTHWITHSLNRSGSGLHEALCSVVCVLFTAWESLLLIVEHEEKEEIIMKVSE
jgi:p-aminobenzoyl-glutamate transporter AbgT